MNLNSYIGLMGGTYRERRDAAGTRAGPAPAGHGDSRSPTRTTSLTLDADSVLLPEYCLRLVHLMEQSEHARVAVAQTPYSAFPGLGDPPRAHRRRHHRPPAHRPPGHDLLRRHLLGRRQRGAAQAGARRHRREDLRRRAGRSAATSRTARSSRTPSRRIDLRMKGWRCSTTPSASATAPPARLRLAVHPAPALGERRAADPAQAAAQSPGAEARGRAQPDQRAVHPRQLHGVGRWSSVSLLLLLVYPFESQLISPLLGLLNPFALGPGSACARSSGLISWR